MTQFDDVLHAYHSGSLSAPQALEQLRAARPTLPPYPLSEGQRGLWVLEKSASGESGYNVPVAFRARGPLSVEKLHAACEFVWSQHPVLRTVIEEVDGVLQQRIAPLTPVPWIVEDKARGADQELLAYLREKTKTPFVLEQGPLFRIHLVSRSPDEYIVLFVIHHLVFDGTSLGVLLRTLLDAYGRLQRGGRLVPALLPAGYRDFVQWERSMLDSESGRDHRAYWLQQLAGSLPVLELPTDHPRAAQASVAGRTHARALPREQVLRIRAVSADLNVSVSVLLLGVYELLLHRYTGESDLIVGMPTAGRPQARFDGLIGYFVNVIALRHRIVGDKEFAAWARSLQLTLLEGLDHADYPFARVVRDLRTERRQPRGAIFQVAYEYQNASMLTLGGLRAASPEGLAIEPVAGLHQEGEYELVLEVVEREADLALHLKYDAKLYSETTIARMADHYLNILLQVLEQPGLPLSAYSPMTVAESQQVLEAWNATEAPYPHDRGIHELFAEQALRTLQATAVVFEDQRLTYRDLDARSDQLALRLCREGVRAGDRVALCVERSLDLPVGLLGILKSGAAYVPLDPTYPRDRVGYMLKDSGAKIVVTQSRLRHLFGDSSLNTVCLDGELGGSQDKAALPPPARGDALAYVMYTSGSTGQPKGVMISHRAVVNFLASMGREPGLASRDRLLAVTTYSFDISGLELYLPLLTGAECHICSAEKARDPKLLAQEIARVRPTVMQATPTTWSMLVQVGWENREGVTILCGGEALPQALRRHFVHHGWQAWNLYGPTETTIWSTIENITAPEAGSIGKPIANTQIYILDAYHQPAPVLVPGELCIAGDGLALGYLDQPELTVDKFIANPFRPGSKMYRTGDLACWRPDGTIEYLGRGDGQVKVRGHRVELGEIEARLAAHPRIRASAVVVCETQGHKHLTACCVLADGEAALDLTSSSAVRALREYLQAGLPDYMVPSRFLEVQSLPLTPNGKVDRKRLAQIATAAQTTAAEVVDAPQASPSSQQEDSDIAERVRRIWQRALAVSGVGEDDGFFDLGGDSVMAVTVAARIEREFGHAFGATEMFRFGTIRQIARHLQGLQEAPRAPAPAPTAKAPAPAAASPGGAADDRDCVAIIGISCQFPGASDHRQFWSNLVHGVESLQRLSPEALARAGVPASILADASYVPVQATIDGKQFFDAEFFKVSPRDAELMDPQLRLLLQHGWQAVEDAGYAARAIPETSVWIASSHSGYAARAHAARSTAAGLLGGDEQYVSWLLAQSGTIPTLISHRLGFKGPSQAVHSNCSSSLIAINAAYRSLVGGETKYALVGAATIFADESLGYVHQPGLNFSSDGHVRTFDASADGMVGGEGVAVVLLKRAADAIADGDHIYALIRGVAVNNDGADKAGFYAPSVEGQTDVIVKALHAANVDARSIGYVEAHGTGTALGDPIELQAISAAYRRTTADTEFCGIGSVKTNIGHVDTAAGLAGVIKVALSLENRELPPTLHYRQPNPRFAFRESPFYVVDQRRPWDQGAGARRAAVSSFGIGGTNAHAILEEAPGARRDGTAGAADDRPALIVLSARTAEQLRERAEQLLAYVSTSQPADGELFDIAYTLQVGREAMEHRLAFAAASVQRLRNTLRTFVNGDADGVYRGEAHKDKEMWGGLTGDAEFAETIDKWMQRGKYKRLLELWVKGFPVEWSKLYAEGGSYAPTQPRRVSLPGYPFAKRRYWIESTPLRSSGEAGSVLHPLVQRNTSDLEDQRFSSTFHGTEFYLHDHLVNGRKVLPAVCYLEMARVALEHSAAPRDGHDTVVILEDVVWMRPVIVDGAKDVHVGLHERDDGEVEFKIYSDADTTHAQGRALLVDAGAVKNAERLDLAALRARCPEVIDGALSYSTFRAVGVDYGPAHQGLTRIHAGIDADGQGFALAHVTLPPCVNDTRERFVLHPTILDCALQATIGLSLHEASSAGLKPSLPFGLERLEILDRSPDVAWVVVRPSLDASGSGSIRKLEIDVCDEEGRVCVRLRGFSSRAIAGDLESPAAASSTMLLSPRWEAQPLPETAAWPGSASRVLLVGGTPPQQQAWRQRYPQLQVLQIEADTPVNRIADVIAGGTAVDHVAWLAPASAPGSVADEALIEGQEAGVIGLYRLIKALLQLGYGARPLGFTAVTWQCQAVDRSEQLDPTHAGVHGLIGSLAKEYDGWKVRLVDGPPADETLVERVLRVPADPNGDAWVYRAGEWYRQQLIACELEAPSEAPYRQGGVYVVIGGAGGIGEVLSEHLIRNHGARLVWLGRSAMSAAIEAKIARLTTLGPAPMYLACDAADRDSLEQAYRRIKAEHGQIHGVVHAAIVLLDKSLAQMEEDRFRASLAAKVDVSVRLAQVFAQEALDFVVFFSSLQSFSKAAGQSNYAAGCTFKDAFASRLALEWPSAVKVMNWGYWGSVGIVASE
ncbi:MAG TPA: amino acid adenylation domain-containing protein, partial [Kofleriaceae bacterium]|nr:amino acid adenylation domain-containing protein [Kofleriaceae bacterium]